MLFGTLLTVSLALFASNGDALEWKQCENKDHILVKQFDLSPFAMKLPGKAEVSADISILKELTGSDATITIQRHVFLLGYLRVPCVSGIGSCTYNDTCTLMKRNVSENLGGFLGPIVNQLMKALEAAGAHANCPVPVQHVKLVKVQLDLPKVPSYVKVYGKISNRFVYNFYERVLDITGAHNCLSVEVEYLKEAGIYNKI